MSQRKLYTLVFARKDNEVLLGLKKRGFGKGLWNGFGGKVEPNETLPQAAVREMEEESSIIINPKNLNHIGHLEFYFTGEPLIMEVKVYSTFIFEGQPKESEEMHPRWYQICNVPFKDMWPDDKYWFPHLLTNKCFIGKFWYTGNEIIRHELSHVKREELLELLEINK